MEYEQVFEDDEDELPDNANPIDEENVKLKKRAIYKPASLEDEDEGEILLNKFRIKEVG